MYTKRERDKGKTPSERDCLKIKGEWEKGIQAGMTAEIRERLQKTGLPQVPH